MPNRKIQLLAWTIMILVLISWPMKPYNGTEFTFYDKFVHMVLFGVFAYLFFLVLTEAGIKIWRALALSLAAAAGYSAICEFIQIYVPGRSVTEYDFYAGVLGAVLALAMAWRAEKMAKPRLLLHICCVGCGVYVADQLSKDYRVALFFHNPNIFPNEEYEKRLQETRKIAKRYKLKLIVGEYDHPGWLKKVAGMESEPERGSRCRVCYWERLEAAAKQAGKDGYAAFATTLSTSPHKDAAAINVIGSELAKQYDLKFLDQDFKKNSGFTKSAAISKQLGLYRQDYCGCEFSRRK